jgi:hypothetical protein
MKIALVTDAWEPQVNGVVRTLKNTARELQLLGHTVEMITPLEFRTLPCPTYRHPPVAFPGRESRAASQAGSGCVPYRDRRPAGTRGTAVCDETGHPFTTAYHARFPEYTTRVACRCRGPTRSCAGFTVREAVMAPTVVMKWTSKPWVHQRRPVVAGCRPRHLCRASAKS